MEKRDEFKQNERKRKNSEGYQNQFTKLHIGSPKETKQKISQIVEQMDYTGHGYESYELNGLTLVLASNACRCYNSLKDSTV